MASTKAIAAIALTLIIAVPIGLGYVLAFDEEETTNWETTEQYNVSDLLLNSSSPYYQVYTGPNNNMIRGGAGYVSTGTTPSSLQITERTSHTISLTTSYQALSESTVFGFLPTYGMLQLTSGNGEVVQYSETASSRIYFEKFSSGAASVRVTDPSDNVTVHNYTNIVKVEVKTTGSGAWSWSYYYLAPTGQYADPAAGWQILQGAPVDWSNGFYNDRITFMVDFKDYGQPSADVLFGLGGESYLYLKMTAGNVSYGFASFDGDNELVLPTGSALTALGKYPTVRVVITEDSYIISGIAAWPSMGVAANVLNTVTVPHDVNEDLLHVEIFNTDGLTTLRCDSADILAGSFPSTKDYTLDLVSLYPGSLMSLKLNSIGVYGDSLTVGGVELPVTDGKVHVDGKNVSLKGAVVSFLPDEEGWLSCYINGRDLGMHFAALPSVTFGGEWSLTAIAFKVEQVAGTSVEWHAGDFGLDQGGIIAAGLLTCIGAFVFLGMYGKASGTKIGLLAVVCGGAAIVLFMMI